MLSSRRGLPGLVNRRAAHLEPVAARYYGDVHLTLSSKIHGYWDARSANAA